MHLKYLRTTLDDKCSFQQQTVDLHKKLTSSIRQFYFRRDVWSTALPRVSYFIPISSPLKYGLLRWKGTFKTFIDSLRTTIFFFELSWKNERKSYFPLNIDFYILPIQHLFVKQSLRLFYMTGSRVSDNLIYNTINVTKKYYSLPLTNLTKLNIHFKYFNPLLDDVINTES